MSLHRSRDIHELRTRSEAAAVVEAGLAQAGRRFVYDLLGRQAPTTADGDADAAFARASEALIDRLLTGDLVLVRRARPARLLDAPRATPLSDLMDPVDAPPEIDTTWIAIRLVHETGGHYAGIRLVAELADGTMRDLDFDGASRMRLDDIPAGAVVLRWEPRDLSEAEYIRPSTDETSVAQASSALDPRRAMTIRLAGGREHLVVVAKPKRVPTFGFIGACFKLDSAFPTPGVTSMLTHATEYATDNPDARYTVFGHCDRSGQEDHNKRLSDRRAAVMHALMTADYAEFESVADQESWDVPEYQAMLRTVGNNPGAIDGVVGELTERATAAFRAEYGRGRYHAGSTREMAYGPLTEGRQLDDATKRAIRDAYHASLMVNIAPTRFVGPVCAGCGEFNPTAVLPEHKQRRVTLAIYPDTPSIPSRFPCTRGDVGACTLDERDDVRCRFYREHFEDPGPTGSPFAFWDGRWLSTPTGHAHLSALTDLADCDDVDFEIQVCSDRRAEELDGDVGLPPNFGPSLGTISGMVRSGIAYALWEPPGGYDPFDLRDWFRPPGAMDVEFSSLSTPVFSARRGGRWIAGVTPGYEPGRVHFDAKSTGEAVALRADGTMVLTFDVAGVTGSVGDPHIVAMLPGEHAVFHEESD